MRLFLFFSNGHSNCFRVWKTLFSVTGGVEVHYEVVLWHPRLSIGTPAMHRHPG
jgi:hypothetical protein